MRNFSCPIKWSRNNNKDYLLSHHKTLVIACVRCYKQIHFFKRPSFVNRMSIREISEERYTIQAEIVNTKLHGRCGDYRHIK